MIAKKVSGLDMFTKKVSGLDMFIKKVSGLDMFIKKVSGLDMFIKKVSGLDMIKNKCPLTGVVWLPGLSAWQHHVYLRWGGRLYRDGDPNP